MRVWRLLIAVASCVGIGAPGTALAGTACPKHFHSGVEPALPPKLTQKSRELCYSSFALLHSGVSRTALWSAEHLTRQSIKAARALERTSEFFSEPRLPAAERAELSDYKRSGFDRGHLAPSGNQPSPKAQQQSFTLANIIPQTANLNRRAWRSIEGDVRDTVLAHGSAYVVTGPLFVGNKLQSLRGRVLVPTHVWKAVHVPRQGAVVYVATNDAHPSITRMTVSQFARTYAINPFPALTGASRHRLLTLQ